MSIFAGNSPAEDDNNLCQLTPDFILGNLLSCRTRVDKAHVSRHAKRFSSKGGENDKLTLRFDFGKKKKSRSSVSPDGVVTTKSRRTR